MSTVQMISHIAGLNYKYLQTREMQLVTFRISRGFGTNVSFEIAGKTIELGRNRRTTFSFPMKKRAYTKLISHLTSELLGAMEKISAAYKNINEVKND